jgi:N-acetylneuraminic acid mutarotase
VGRGSADAADRAVRRYHPLSDSWTTYGGVMPEACTYSVEVALNGFIYVLGAGSGTSAARRCYRMDLTDRSFTLLADMPSDRWAHQAAALDGKIHVIGGRIGTSGANTTHWLYDPATNTWATLGVAPGVYDGAITVVGGSLYLYGGYQGGTLSRRVWRWNAATDTWTELPMMAGNASVGANNGTAVYKVFNGNVSLINAFEVYNVAGAFWEARPSPPFNRTDLGPAAPVMHGVLFIIGGFAYTGTGLEVLWTQIT